LYYIILYYVVLLFCMLFLYFFFCCLCVFVVIIIVILFGCMGEDIVIQEDVYREKCVNFCFHWGFRYCGEVIIYLYPIYFWSWYSCPSKFWESGLVSFLACRSTRQSVACRASTRQSVACRTSTRQRVYLYTDRSRATSKVF